MRRLNVHSPRAVTAPGALAAMRADEDLGPVVVEQFK
jgi:hypothetical protein